MSNCNAQIQAELRAIRAAIAQLQNQKVDEESIAQRAMQKVFAASQWLSLVSNVNTVSGIANSSYNTLNTIVKPKVETLYNWQSEANSWMNQTDAWKNTTTTKVETVSRKADGLLGKINQAIQKADNAFSKATDAIGQVSVLGSTVGRLFSVATTAFNIASSLISLYGVLKVLPERIDSVENQVDNLSRDLSRIFTSIGLLKSRFEREIAEVRRIAGDAATLGLRGIAIGLSAEGKAGIANSNALSAAAKALNAERVAYDAQAKSIILGATVAGLAGTVGGLATRVNQALNVANLAKTTADIANSGLGVVRNIAQTALERANRALGLSGKNTQQTTVINNTVNRVINSQDTRALSVAQSALGVAQQANTKSDRAVAIAQQALNKPSISGPRGLQGIPGRNGVDGKNGTNGKDGVTRREFITEIIIRDGKPGRDGKNGKDATLSPEILQRLRNIDSTTQNNLRVSSVTSVGVAKNGQMLSNMGSKFDNLQNNVKERFDKLSKRLKLPEIINALTLIIVLHNALMLSNQALSTIGDLMSQGLAIIGLRDENNQPHDINAIIGKTVNEWIASIVGEENLAQLKDKWDKANRTYQAATNIYYGIQSMMDASRAVAEWTAENTGKIGNALKKYGVVGDKAYGWMPENVNSGNAKQRKFDRVFEGLESIENTASSLSVVTSNTLTIQQEFTNFSENKTEFENSLKDLAPKQRAENQPVKQQVEADKAASVSPEIVDPVGVGRVSNE